MALTETIWLRHACGGHCRSLHRSRLSAGRSPERVQTDGRCHGCCSLETSTYNGYTNFDRNNLTFNPYAYVAHQSYVDSNSSSNGFDHARANESRYNRQASRRATRLHW